ncbi:MAG TPA: hypothetical protein VIL60_09850 [Rhodanobacter sp.]
MRRTFRLHKDPRRRLVWLVTAMLLWQQVAVAAYACVVPVSTPAVATPVQTSSMMAMGDDCEHMKAVSADPLCSKHCQPDHATQVEARVTSVPLSALAALPPAPLSVATMLPPSNRALARLDRLIAPPPTPRLLFCSLLI